MSQSSSSSSSSGGSVASSSMMTNGRTIKIIGGSSHSTMSIEGGQHIIIDGKIDVVVTPQEVRVNENKHPIPDYREVVVRVEDGETTILVDGKSIN